MPQNPGDFLPNVWLLRLIPEKRPPFWIALLATLGAVGVALVIRYVVLGYGRSVGFAASYFPALVFITLYCGGRWAVSAMGMLAAVGIATSAASRVPGASPAVVMSLFMASGLLMIGVTSFLAETLRRLRASHAAQLELKEEQARIERRLARREERLRLAQEAAGVGLYDWDLVTLHAYWSPTFFKNVGIEAITDAASAQSLLRAIHPDDRERVAAVMARANEEGQGWEMEYRVIHPDGSVHWLLSRGEVIRDEKTGKAVRAIGMNLDITGHRMAEERVRESEARFRALADSAPTMMWVTGVDRRRIFVNKAYSDFLGAPYEEALVFDWRERLHPEDVDRIVAESVAGEASLQLFMLEGRYRRADGEWRWLKSFSQPRHEPDGAFAGFIGIAVDVTEAKQAEADLLRINELLEERVAAALSERDTAQAALLRAQKLEAVGQLTGGVAHDFNNLLTVIIGALDMMSRHPTDAHRRERMIEAARGAAQRGERLTGQLLSFARRQSLRPEPTAVDALLAEAESLLRRACGEAVAFSVSLGAKDAIARIDTAQFEAAIMNLVVNARDAAEGGVGAIRLETRACELPAGEVEDAPAGAYICVAVHDTGAGMDEATIARAFEPFFTTKPVGKGTGLGLSQVYGFARQSGGAAAIDSAPGKGTTVRLYLPRTEPAAEGAAAEAPDTAAATASGPAEPPRPKARVLLVEDDAPVGDVVAAMLADLGHETLRAETGEAALKLLDAEPAERIDLLLTDLVMPGGVSGLDLAKAAVARRPGLPVILSSGYTGETLTGADASPWPLLRKPYDVTALAAAIEAVMAGVVEVA